MPQLPTVFQHLRKKSRTNCRACFIWSLGAPINHRVLIVRLRLLEMLKVSLGAGTGPEAVEWGCVSGAGRGHWGVPRGVPRDPDPSPCKGTRLGGGCSNLLDAACRRLSRVETALAHQSYIWGRLGRHSGAFPPPAAVPREPPTHQYPRSPPPSPDGSGSGAVPLQPSTVLLASRGRHQLLCERYREGRNLGL